MKFHTKKYDITKVDSDEFNGDIQYEVNLKAGYIFEDGTHLNYASDINDLKSLITEIIPEKI